MKFSPYLAGSTLVVMAAVAQPTITLALEATQIKEIADNIMVRVDVEITQTESREKITTKDHGSGIIIGRDSSSYYVLTAKHVFEKINTESAKYTIVAPDGERYQLDKDTIKNINDVDMAVVSFQSDRAYKIAQIERSEGRITPGIPVYINGFPQKGQEIEDGAQFTTGSLTGTNEQTIQGYDLVYSNFTRRGMSGGPVLNEQGHLIGMHGRAAREETCEEESSESNPLGIPTIDSSETSKNQDCDAEAIAQQSEKIDLNLGISIFTFLERADSIGMGEILDTTVIGTPSRPERIKPAATTGTGCSGLICP